MSAQEIAAPLIKVGEGFPNRPPIAALKNAWNSTLYLSVVFKSKIPGSIDSDHGTAAVVFKEQRDGSIYLGIVTAKHVLTDHPVFETSFYKNRRYTVEENGEHTHASGEILKSKIVFHDMLKGFDLAFFVIKVSASDGDSFTPIALPRQCNVARGDFVAMIGFPETADRALPQQKIKINEPNVTKKRWSSGVYLASQVVTPEGPSIETTADAIQGNSGSPVLNKAGELIGILSASDHGGQIYSGSEVPGHLDSQSAVVGCDVTKSYLEKSWRKFISLLSQRI